MRNTGIGYINPEIPRVSVRPAQGRFYEANVPDTLDLAARADLAIHALTHTVNDHQDYEMYFLADMYCDPPVMWHTGDAVNCQYKMMEALPLLRLVTGNRNRLVVDQRWKEVSLQLIGPDGLAYWPEKGRMPWGRLGAGFTVPLIGDRSQGQYCTYGYLGRLLATWSIYHTLDGNPVWEECSRRMIDRLSGLVVDRGDFVYFPQAGIAPGAEFNDDMPMPVDGWWSCTSGWLIEGLAHHYRVFRYEPALDLAVRLTRFLKDVSGQFDSEGRFTGVDHYHAHTAAVLGMAELALVTNNPELAGFVRKAYNYAKQTGDPLVGFFPENHRYPRDDGTYEYRVRKIETAETCEVADMIAIGLKLADMGHDDCLDDVDRWIRNQFVENQMVDTGWVERLQDSLDVIPMRKLSNDTREGPFDTTRSDYSPERSTGNRVAERMVGCFAGWPLANDLVAVATPGQQFPGHTFMNCCLGNGARAIYYAWEHILDFKDGTLSVNLLLNRASTWADVNSHIPCEGRVDIHVKRKCHLEIRIPDWVEPDQVECRMNGKARELQFRGRYAVIGRTGKGNRVDLCFPITERSLKTRLGGRPYELIIRGNEVVSIDPPGKYYPYYQRNHYREDQVRWKRRNRFVSDRLIQW